MILITSMGGCGSTELMHWMSHHIDCNCSMNSEGLPQPGPGANCKGLKHRICPPQTDDPYLPFNKVLERSLFMFDSPLRIVPSLFRRRIAAGHAVAITGRRTKHDNNLDSFLEAGVDSFGFEEQFNRWSRAITGSKYPRMLLRASAIWSHLPIVFAYLGIPDRLQSSFPKWRERQSSFNDLSEPQQVRLKGIYGKLDSKIARAPDIKIV